MVLNCTPTPPPPPPPPPPPRRSTLFPSPWFHLRFFMMAFPILVLRLHPRFRLSTASQIHPSFPPSRWVFERRCVDRSCFFRYWFCCVQLFLSIFLCCWLCARMVICLGAPGASDFWGEAFFRILSHLIVCSLGVVFSALY